VQRYGADTVRGWYFEVWNEPDIDYWHGTPEQYWKLYDTAVARGCARPLPGRQGRRAGDHGTRLSPRPYKFLDDFLTHVTLRESAAGFHLLSRQKAGRRFRAARW
jgi:xylan 1,4-beta-xylosidase